MTTISVLTPLQLDAGAGLLQNQGLTVNTVFSTTVASYTGNYSGTGNLAPQTAVTGLLATIRIGGANVGNGAILSNTVIANLQTLASNSCPALSDSVPSTYSANLVPLIDPPGFTGILLSSADTYLGNGDLTKFVQGFSIAQSYTSQTNLFVDSAVNSQTYLGNTFTNMNNMITGDITTVNLATQAFGTDLQNLGALFDLSSLETLGSPLALIQRIVSVTGNIPVLNLLLLAEGVTEDIVLTLTDPDLSVADSVQRLMYQAMTKITGSDLAQILKVLKITTPNIETMADLLNPVKIFPRSFQSLTVVTSNGTRAIYVNNLGAVNTNLVLELPDYVIAQYNRLQQIIPADQALANKALGMALSQISGINFISLSTLANVVLAVKTTQDLPLITALEQPVPSSVANYYINSLANGTGVNGTVLITDILGTAIGYVSTDALGNTVATFTTMNLTYLQSVYSAMANTVNGQYDSGNGVVTIPGGTPGAGEYTDINLAFEGESTGGNVAGGPGLIPVATTEIANIVAGYPNQILSLNQDWNSMAEQLVLEKTLQNLADLNYANLTSNQRTSMYGFIFNLPSYGLDTKIGGTAQFIEGIANLASFTGQAVVGCLREGVNQQALNNAGIQTNSNIPAEPNPPPPQANLIPSIYTESEAANLVVR
jgi:hypothetical protein